jgi:hypothetical protein
MAVEVCMNPAVGGCNSGGNRGIVRTYGHFASRIPVLYVLVHLLRDTSKIRPIFKVEGHDANSCPKAPKIENLKAFYGAQLCEDLIDLSGTRILLCIV